MRAGNIQLITDPEGKFPWNLDIFRGEVEENIEIIRKTKFRVIRKKARRSIWSFQIAWSCFFLPGFYQYRTEISPRRWLSLLWNQGNDDPLRSPFVQSCLLCLVFWLKEELLLALNKQTRKLLRTPKFYVTITLRDVNVIQPLFNEVGFICTLFLGLPRPKLYTVFIPYNNPCRRFHVSDWWLLVSAFCNTVPLLLNQSRQTCRFFDQSGEKAKSNMAWRNAAFLHEAPVARFIIVSDWFIALFSCAYRDRSDLGETSFFDNLDLNFAIVTGKPLK